MKKKVTFFLVIIIIAGCAFFAGYGKGKLKDKPEITSSSIENRLSAVKDLVTTEYHYKNMGSFDNQNTFYGWKVPFTEKKFILTYEGTIKLGVNLKNISVKIKGKDINIEIPDAKIISNEIDESSIKVFDEKTSIFNPIVIEDYKNFAEKQKKEVAENAVKKGIIAEADKNSAKVIKEIFLIDPDFNSYNINISIKK